MGYSRIIHLASGALLVGAVVMLVVRNSTPEVSPVTASSAVGSALEARGSHRTAMESVASDLQVSSSSPAVGLKQRKPSSTSATADRIPASLARNGKSNRAGLSNPGTNSSPVTEDENSKGLIEAAASPVSEPAVWHSANPRLVGNSLSHAGQRAEVIHYQPSPGAPGVGLSLNVTHGNEAPPQPPPVDPAVPSTVEPHLVATAGFTYEQELFRTRWGWAAYDQVQKILREETSD